MRKILTAILLVLILSSCEGNITEETPTPSRTQTKMPETPTPSTPTPSTPAPTELVNPDWSKYINNQDFITILADLNELGKGHPVIVTSETHKLRDGTKVNSLAEAWESYFDGLCDKDLSHLDLRKSSDELQRLYYDSYTLWPELLPEGFDPAALLERSKNPGLGIRALHDKGYTGKGVSIGIVDTSLLVEHEEYKDNIMLYEKLHAGTSYAVKHGSAVTSIAAGKDIGVAPDAKVYYISSQFGVFSEDGSFQHDAEILADCILRLLEVNKQLPDGEKISVISISSGTNAHDKGYDAYISALEIAKNEGVLVITVDSLEYVYNFNFNGLDLNTTGHPDDVNSYRPALWLAEKFYKMPNWFDSIVLVPMGGRTIAGERGINYYQYEDSGSISWAVPWMAGFYALCKQANPELTPETFLKAITATTVPSTFEHEGKQYTLPQIINPESALDLLLR